MDNYYYNKIARDYHLKRLKPWKPLEIFLKHLNKKGYHFEGICADLGCANGRHFKILKTPKNKVIGIDNSIEFLKIAKENLEDLNQYTHQESNNIDIILGDINKLPLREDHVQNFFSIATIHHIKSKERRRDTISQLYNLLNPQGLFLATVWRKWQKKYRNYFYTNRVKRFFNPHFHKRQNQLGLNEHGDNLVPWTISSKGETYNRFYHFFSKREIKKLLEKHFFIKEFNIIGGASNKDNFFILVQKRSK